MRNNIIRFDPPKRAKSASSRDDIEDFKDDIRAQQRLAEQSMDRDEDSPLLVEFKALARSLKR